MSSAGQIDFETEPTEEQLKWHELEMQYKAQIDSLTEDKLQLEVQVKQVQTYMSTIEKFQTENAQLKQEVGDLRAEINDANHRLELSIAAKKEAETLLSQEKERHQQARSEEYHGMNETFDRKATSYEQQIKELNEKLKTYEEQLQQADVQQKLVKSKTDRLLTAANRYFDASFSSLEDLTKKLEQPPTDAAALTQSAIAQRSPTRSPSKMQTRTVVQQSNVDEQALKRAKARNRELKARCADLEEQLDHAAEEHKKQVQADQKELSKLKIQLQSTRDQSDYDKQLSQRQISSLQGQIDSLKTELKNTKEREKTEMMSRTLTTQLSVNSQEPSFAAPTMTQPTASLAPQTVMATGSGIVDPQQSQIAQVQAQQQKEIENLKKEIQERLAIAESKVKEATRKESDLTRKISQLESDKNSLQSENSQLKTQVDCLNTNNAQLNSEIDALRSALHAKQPKEPVQKPQVPPPNYKADMKKLRDEIDDLNKKIIEQEIEVNNSANKIEDLNKEINNQTKRADEAEEKCRQLTMDLRESETRVSNLPRPDPNDLLPPEAYHSNDWATELAASIDRIASNPSLQPRSKLQHVFGEIQSYYKVQIETREKEINECHKEAQTVRAKVDEFLVDASIALCDQSVSYDQFINTDAGQTIVNQITQLRRAHDDLKIKNEEQLSVIDHLIECFQFEQDYDAVTIMGEIDDIKQRIELQTQQFENTRRKARQYKKDLEALQASNKAALRELQSQTEALEEEKEAIAAELEATKVHLHETQELSANLQSQIEQTLTERELTDINSQSEAEKQMRIMQEQHAQREILLQQEIQACRSELLSTKSKIEELIAKANTLSSSLKESQRKCTELQDQYDKKVEEEEQRVKEIETRAAAEKEKMKKEYDTTLQTVTQQKNALSSDLQKFAQQLSEEQVKNKALRQTVHNLQREKAVAAEEKKKLTAQFEREKLLIDAQARKRIIDEQAQMNEKLLAQQSKFTEEKKKIFNVFADKFRKFYNPLKALDEREYKAGVERAYDEYTRLENSDDSVRRMLGAKDKQTTEDAVAQMLVARN